MKEEFIRFEVIEIDNMDFEFCLHLLKGFTFILLDPLTLLEGYQIELSLDYV
jgi:hypothetical protein